MGEHDCESWTGLGIGCPSGLLEAVGIEGGEGEHDFTEVMPLHSKAKKVPPDQTRTMQMVLLMELWRQQVLEGAGNVIGEFVPAPAVIPVEMVREAWGEGYRGKALGLVVAAAAASAAIGLAYGGSAAQRLPGLLVQALSPQQGSRGRGRGYAFNWSQRVRALLAGGGYRKMGWSSVSTSFSGGFSAM